MPLTDEQIAALTPAQRRALLQRLRAAPGLTPPPQRWLGRARFWIAAVGSLVLVPWTVYLGISLPGRYVVRGWFLVWVGFDVVMIALLAATAWFGLRRRWPAVATGFAAGVLILADAWFDVMTSERRDARASLAAAVLVEIPVAAVLISSAVTWIRAAARDRRR